MALQGVEQPVCSYRRSGLDNRRRVTPGGPMTAWRAATAEPPNRNASCAVRRLGSGRGAASIVVPRIRLGLVRGEDPEKVVGPWRSADQEQEPRCRQAGQLQDAAEESVMLCTFEAKLRKDVRVGEALLVGWERPVADPRWVREANGGQVGYGRGALHRPHSICGSCPPFNLTRACCKGRTRSGSATT